MENPICRFQIVQNPNRKYANTVNLVFFRAFPIYKNFNKYIDGLKHWSRYMKYYPHSQLQIFIDKTIAADPAISPILRGMDARVYVFECPPYKEGDHHIGLFPTMIRFYPIFDVNTNPMRVAHIQELEPDEESVDRFSSLEHATRLSAVQKHRIAMVYPARNFYEVIDWPSKPTFEDGISYPWCTAGRFAMTQKVPFNLWTAFLRSVDSGKPFINRYAATQEQNSKPEHKQYHFGVDEAFLNQTLVPWVADNGYGIGIVSEYKFTYPMYYMQKTVIADKRSPQFLNYILQSQHPLRQSLQIFDTLFEKRVSPNKLHGIATRFYQCVERYPDWLGIHNTRILLAVFKGYLTRDCMIIIRNKKIVDIVDLV